MLIVLIYIKRPKQFLWKRGAGLPAEFTPTPFKGDAQNPREKREEKDSTPPPAPPNPGLAGFCQKPELGLNIHHILHVE